MKEFFKKSLGIGIGCAWLHWALQWWDKRMHDQDMVEYHAKACKKYGARTAKVANAISFPFTVVGSTMLWAPVEFCRILTKILDEIL